MKTSVQKKIKEVALKFARTDYFYGTPPQIDKWLDNLEEGITKLERPVICHLLALSGALRPHHSATTFTDNPQTTLYFLVPTDFDFDGEENEDLVEVMKHLAAMFIVALNESGYFEPIDNEDVAYRVPIDTYDANMTGIEITLNLVELQGRTYCNIENRCDNFGYHK